MKRIICITLSMVLSFSLMACGSSKKETKSNDSVNVEKKIVYVDITMPADMLEDSTQEELETAAKEAGYKVKFNEDGSATYTMTKSQHREVLKGLAKDIDDGLVELTKDSSIKNIKANSKYTAFDVTVDREAFENSFDIFNLYGIAFYSSYYQLFSGVSQDEMDITMNLIDEATNEVYDTITKEDLETESEE